MANGLKLKSIASTNTRSLARFFVVLAGLLAGTKPVGAATLVEVTLVNKIDEPRGFCLDIVGAQRRAVPERGLQAHTCYSYQGKIAADQGFDGERLTAGEFRLPEFEVCMAVIDSRPGSTLGLRPCDGGARQQFELKPAGEIIAGADPALCLTVGDGEIAMGKGGQPVHLIRRLTLEPCSEARAAYQKWRIREKDD